MSNSDPFAKLGGGALDQQLFRKNPTPPEQQPERPSALSPTSSAQQKAHSVKRKQISAYLTHDQLVLLKQLHFSLNTGEATIEKSEIIGLGIELVSRLLSTHVPTYSDIEDLRKYLNTQISTYLDTQAP